MKKPASTSMTMFIAFLLFLFSVGSPAAAQDNATITGDGVNLRAEPASSGKRLDTIPKGTRVEVLFVAGFSETIGGNTGSWCAAAYGGETGFVFGPYIALDSGSIPIIVGPAYGGAGDRLFYFAETMKRLFGDTRADVHKRLGEPASVWEGKWGKCEGVGIKVLRYPDAEVELFYPIKKCGFLSEREFVSGVTITGGDRRVLGIGVGSPVEDVRETLGPDFTDNALRADLYDLGYTSEEYPQYVIDFIYEEEIKGDAVVSRLVKEIRFIYNVLGD